MDYSPFNAATLSLLGESVTLTYAAGGGATIQAVFTQEYASEPTGIRATRQRQATIVAADIDIALLQQGDGVQVGAVQYHVAADPEPDGVGMSRVPLRKSA